MQNKLVKYCVLLFFTYFIFHIGYNVFYVRFNILKMISMVLVIIGFCLVSAGDFIKVFRDIKKNNNIKNKGA